MKNAQALLASHEWHCRAGLGEYIGRIYKELRTRPKFIIDHAESFDH